MIDLWGEEPEAEEQPTARESSFKEELSRAVENRQQILVTVAGETITLSSFSDLTKEAFAAHVLNGHFSQEDGVSVCVMPLRPLNAFVLRHTLAAKHVKVAPPEAKKLAEYADRIPKPTVKVGANRKHIEVTTIPIGAYREALNAVGAYPEKNGHYRFNIARLLDFRAIVEAMDTPFPKFTFDEEVDKLVTEPIEGFDGSLASLKHISIGVLNVIKANAQSYKATKKSPKTVQEKFEAFGLVTLYDLITFLPRRYIDKSNPQDISDLLIDESATVVGKVAAVAELPGGKGVVFGIETEGGDKINVTFWRQTWLKAKFKLGSEVLVTGKFTIFNRKPQLNGSSIEFANEAAALPIVPIYKQSESRGVTTALILSAVRELFSRLGPIELPSYLQGEGRTNFSTGYRELHVPSNLKHYETIINHMAYYELVYMQLLIQASKELEASHEGLDLSRNPQKDYQKKAIDLLPFQLTASQKKAVQELNVKLGDSKPASVLLNADTGSGKTIVAQLACLRAVEAGYQAVMMSPTDILAQQLYNTFVKIIDSLKKAGKPVEIAYLSGSLKAAEKKALLKRIAEGEVDIVVSTQSAVSKSVKYKNLGFVCIDEQQKFGAEQRTALLASRNDNRVPDFLMQSATPIPRSTAQVFYGDIDMILLNEKPPGRIPIITEWIEEDPETLFEQKLTSFWNDLRTEAEAGNQIFFITPLVSESTTVDAASVERTYKNLQHSPLGDLPIGFVHGRMKQEEQRQVMEDFRAKKYVAIVASTVVEVGVDIPDATRCVVLSADRLGASSLHQIRGRVGRNNKRSIFYLVSLGKTENSRLRLQSLVDNDSGFEVAKADLKLRGEGMMFGSSQSGASETMFASLVKHGKWVPRAKEEALAILASPAREQALQDSRERFSFEGRLV